MAANLGTGCSPCTVVAAAKQSLMDSSTSGQACLAFDHVGLGRLAFHPRSYHVPACFVAFTFTVGRFAALGYHPCHRRCLH